MSARTQQVASALKQGIQTALMRGLNDPRIRGLISVTRVEVMPDLTEARVFVSILPEERESLSLHGLRSAAGHIRAVVARGVRLRSMPRLTFHIDETLKRHAAVERAIREALDDCTSGAGETPP